MKRIAGFTVTALMLSVLLIVSAAAALLGDADNNGKVQAKDARIILRHAAKIEEITDENALKLSDVDGSGKVNAKDARLALRIAGKIDPAKEYVEPATGDTSDVPTVPTSEPTTVPPIPTAPTTVVEPTTEPVEPTTEPVEPTSEPVEPTTEPVEPTTEPVEPTTEPVEPTTEPVEPTTEPDPLDGMIYYENFVIDADIINHYGGTSSSAQRVKIASESKTVDVKGLFGTKSYTLSSQYICSDAISSDSSVGILIKEDLNTLRTGTDKKIYIIDYKTNEYVSISVSVLKSMASMAGADFDVDEMFAGNPLEDTMIPIFTDLSNKDVSEAEYDGKTYTVVTMNNAGVTVKYYVEQRSDGNYYPVVCESYIGDAVDTTIVIHSYENDPSAYLNPPAGMKEYAVNSIVDLMNEDVMRIFTSLGA